MGLAAGTRRDHGRRRWNLRNPGGIGQVEGPPSPSVEASKWMGGQDSSSRGRRVLPFDPAAEAPFSLAMSITKIDGGSILGSYPKSVKGVQTFESQGVAAWRSSRGLVAVVVNGIPSPPITETWLPLFPSKNGFASQRCTRPSPLRRTSGLFGKWMVGTTPRRLPFASLRTGPARRLDRNSLGERDLSMRPPFGW